MQQQTGVTDMTDHSTTLMSKLSLRAESDHAHLSGGHLSSSTSGHLSSSSSGHLSKSPSGHLSAPPAPPHRVRSPSPLDNPAHHHLAMEAKTSHFHNNNVEKDQNLSKVSPPIPSKCSTQLAKVLEKQIEVRSFNAELS